MKKVTARAPANIALIKYWGKRSKAQRIPLNDSFSINLDEATTTTTVEFNPNLRNDEIEFIGEHCQDEECVRVINHLDRIRKRAKTKLYARVCTKNSFPKGTGIASSASGFAALTVAATASIGLHLNEKETTILARLGSGSACRSIPDGFAWWHAGTSSKSSFAESVFPSTWWNIVDVICIVSKETKKVSSSDGMEAVKTSPFWKPRVKGIPEKITQLYQAIKTRNIISMGEILEEDAISMHCVMMTQNPPLFYWNEYTMRVIEAVYALRAEGVPAYFTMDAGPNVHILCRHEDAETIGNTMKSVGGVQTVIQAKPSEGTRIVSDHLF